MGSRKNEVALADAIGAIREQLLRAQREGVDSGLPFAVEAVEIELGVELSVDGGGSLGVNVYAVNIGVEGSAARNTTHRVTVTLAPKDPRTGESAMISSKHGQDQLG
jgi:Trypsin-co-occurring domain 2